MIQYIKMKRKENRLKAMLYKTILSFIDEKSDIMELLHKIYIALKDVPPEEMQKTLMEKLVESIHTEN